MPNQIQGNILGDLAAEIQIPDNNTEIQIPDSIFQDLATEIFNDPVLSGVINDFNTGVLDQDDVPVASNDAGAEPDIHEMDVNFEPDQRLEDELNKLM